MCVLKTVLWPVVHLFHLCAYFVAFWHQTVFLRHVLKTASPQQKQSLFRDRLCRDRANTSTYPCISAHPNIELTCLVNTFTPDCVVVWTLLLIWSCTEQSIIPFLGFSVFFFSFSAASCCLLLPQSLIFSPSHTVAPRPSFWLPPSQAPYLFFSSLHTHAHPHMQDSSGALRSCCQSPVRLPGQFVGLPNVSYLCAPRCQGPSLWAKG